MSAGQHLAFAKSLTSVDNIVVSENGGYYRVEMPVESDEVTPREVNSGIEDPGRGVIPLVGPSSEVEVKVEGKPCQALLDTGAMVSTLTLSLCQQLKLPIHSLSQLVRVEGVGGHSLQYLGYVIAKLEVSDLHQELEAMFLVVPDIVYNCTTPVLIGTNILQHVSGSSQLHPDIQYPWSSVFKCLSAQVTDSSLSGKTTKAYTIPAESGFFLDGIVHAPLFCGRMTVMAEEPSIP